MRDINVSYYCDDNYCSQGLRVLTFLGTARCTMIQGARGVMVPRARDQSMSLYNTFFGAPTALTR